MLSRPHSAIRYSFFFLALILLLTAPIAILGRKKKARRPKPKPPVQAKATPTPTPAALPQIEKMEPNEVARGGPVTFKGQNFPTNPKDITVFLNGANAGTAALVGSDKHSFIFVVPTDSSLGKYKVRVDFKLNNVAVPFSPVMPPDAMLEISSESGKAQPKITAVSPLLTYPEKEVYGFDVLGEGFSKKGTDNGLIIANRGEVQNICWEDDKNCNPNDPTRVHGKAVSSEQLTFSGIPRKHEGVAGVQVRVGQNYSNVFQITLSRVSSKTPMWISLAVFVALIGLVLLLTSRGLRTSPIAGKRYGIITALFLDRETDTYSLSRFQFFIWTAVAVFSYLYLVLSRSLVQWSFEFVDVPPGLPGIILISAGTTVLAQGITNSKGTKGAGEIHPSMSDFISVGGVVVPERFQFFLWTLLGAAVFLFLVLLMDPGTIKDLPQVPSGFLELMGVSSLGYLGGKLVRKPGPVLDEILAKFGSLELTLKGRNLSKDASFLIEGDEVSSDNIEGKMTLVPDDEHPSTNMGKELRFKIKEPKPEWLHDNSKLTIINPDGQKAVWTYEVGPVVTSIEVSREPNSPFFALIMKGVNIDDQTQVELETPSGTPWPAPATVKFESPDTIMVLADRAGGPSGVAVIKNADGRSIRVPFTV
jgi:energy-converting hydrogenase Eha subunit F